MNSNTSTTEKMRIRKPFAIRFVFLVVVLFAKNVFSRGEASIPLPSNTQSKLSATCETIKCFVCRSDEVDGCADDTKFSKECPKKGNATVYCRKISQMLKFKKEESWTSIRECAYEKSPLDCYQFKWLELAYQETCECTEENCNFGNSPTLNILTVFLISLIWILSCFKSDNI